MKALVLEEIGKPLELKERDDLRPRAGHVIVDLHAAALNRRDYWITRGRYPGVRTPAILGSDGAGTVSRIGEGVSADWEGTDVISDPALHWGEDPSAQGDKFRILGMPDDGTFATEVEVPASQLAPRPSHLSWTEAAALPLAGLTAHRALFRQGALKAGERVLVTGIGGGVATFALQFAVAAGATVFVTSSSNSKLQMAADLGALAGANYRNEGWAKAFSSAHGLMDLIVDSAGGEGYASLIDLAAPAGRIVSFGATCGAPEKLDLFKVFWKQLRLVGSTMGCPADFRAMLRLVNAKAITPIVHRVLPLPKGAEALASMESSPQFGKIVLRTEN